jgi:hypothetical protein
VADDGRRPITDELFARIRAHFSDEQLVEITELLTLVNLDRFNAAFGIGSAGFSEGLVCVPPDRPAASPRWQGSPEHRPDHPGALAFAHTGAREAKRTSFRPACM